MLKLSRSIDSGYHRPQKVTRIYIVGVIITLILTYLNPILGVISGFSVTILIYTILDDNAHMLFRANISLKKLLDIHKHIDFDDLN